MIPAADPRSVQDWVRHYIASGFQVIPLEPGTKKCEIEGWIRLIFKPEDFRDNDNIGIRSVSGVVVSDIDSPEAVAAADEFLPETRAIFGRPSKPRSKRLHRSHFEKTLTFKDLETGQVLTEIRVGHQDVAPPSIHPDGERSEWDVFEEVSPVEPAVLLHAHRLIATTSLIGRYYNPPGARHEWTLAVAGALRGFGVTEDDAVKVISEAGKWAREPKPPDRHTEVRSTYGRGEDEPIAGLRELKDLAMVETFTKSLAKIWGTTGKDRNGFVTDDKGKVLANSQDNIRAALDKLDVRLSHDVFSDRFVMTRAEEPPVLVDDAALDDLWLGIDKCFGFRPTRDFFDTVIRSTARHNPSHPVREYLDSLKWDGTPRVDYWLIRGANAPDSAYVRAVSTLPLIAAVRRVRKPGSKFDEMLVLESSKQGLMKSTALRTLCPNEEWFSDDLPLNVETKQLVERTLGKWIIEASDLSGMSPASVEHLKGMLSRQKDGPVRLAYARAATERFRQFVILGTTNSHSYLSDSTGNRRFWPVRVDRFDVSWIAENRDQLWAEASARERAGESIRLDPGLYKIAELQQKRRRTEDAWEPILETAIGPEKYQRLTSEHLWQFLGVPPDRRDARGQKRLGSVMQLLGFRRMTVKDSDGKAQWGWARDDESSLLQDEHEGGSKE